MKRNLAFCSFLLLVIFGVTIAGVAVLMIALSQIEKEPTVIEDEIEDILPEEKLLSIETVLIQFNDEVEGFTALEYLGDIESDQQIYKITTVSGDDRYVAWGTGAIAVSVGLVEISSGKLAPGMERAWAFVDASEKLLLSKEAIILR